MIHNWKLLYAGQDLPVPDENGINIELQPIDTTERNAAGDAMIEEVALKRNISITWSNLNGNKASIIMTSLANNRTGKLEYYDISDGGFVSRDVYYSSGASLTFNRFDNEMSEQKYSSLTVNFIEM